MKKKTANLSVVNNAETKTQRRTWDDLEKEKKQWRITAQEARSRVHGLRHKLESYRDQIEAVPFDIAAGDMNSSYQSALGLVEDLNPVIDRLFQLSDSVAEKHGAREEIDFNAQLFELKRHAADTAFYIGVLAGAMFSGASKETVDRFERGLAFGLASNPWIVRG